MMIFIPQSCASSLILKNAQNVISVVGPTTELSDYITRTSIKQNFVIATLIKYNSANMETTVPSHILLKISKLD